MSTVADEAVWVSEEASRGLVGARKKQESDCADIDAATISCDDADEPEVEAEESADRERDMNELALWLRLDSVVATDERSPSSIDRRVGPWPAGVFLVGARFSRLRLGLRRGTFSRYTSAMRASSPGCPTTGIGWSGSEAQRRSAFREYPMASRISGARRKVAALSGTKGNPDSWASTRSIISWH